MSDSAKKPAPRPAVRERSKSEVGSPPLRASTPTSTKEKIKAALGEKTTPVSTSKRPASVNLTPTRPGSTKKTQGIPIAPVKSNNIKRIPIAESDESKVDALVPPSPRSQIMELFGAGLQSVQNDLESKLADKEAECSRLLQEKARLEAEINSYKSGFNSSDQNLSSSKEFARLKELADNNTFELEELRQYNKRQEDIISHIMREKNQAKELAQKEIDEIKQRNKRQEDIIAGLIREKEEWTTDLEKIKTDLGHKIKEEAQKEIDALKQEITSEKQVQNELKEQLEQLTEEHRKVLEDNLKDPESMIELAALKDENDKLRESETYIGTLLDTIEKMKHEKSLLQTHSKELDKLKFEHKLVIQQYEELKTNKERELNSQHEQALQRLIEEKSKLQSDLNNIQQRYEEALSMQNLDISKSSGLSQSFDEPDMTLVFKIQEERDRALSANENQQKTIDSLQKQVENEQERSNQLQNELRKTKDNLDKLIAMSEQEDLEISELQKTIDIKNSIIDDLNKDILVLKQSHVESLKEKEQIRSELHAGQQILAEKDKEIATLQQKHEILIQRNVSLTNEIDRQAQGKILMEKRITQIEINAIKAQTSVEELAKNRDSQLQEEIQRLNEVIAKLQQKIETLNLNLDELMTVNEEQDKEIDELQNEVSNQRSLASQFKNEKDALHDDFESKITLIANKYTEEREKIENEMQLITEQALSMETNLKGELSIKENQWLAKEEELNARIKEYKDTIQRLRGNRQDSKIIIKATEEQHFKSTETENRTSEEIRNINQELTKLSNSSSSTAFWLKLLTITTGVIVASNVARLGLKHFR